MLQTASIAKLPVYGRIRPSLHGCTRVVIRLETARAHRCRSAGRDGNRTRVTAPVTRLHTVPGGSPTRVTEDEYHISIELPQALPERTSRSTVDGSGSVEPRTSVTEGDIIMELPVFEQTPCSTVDDTGAMEDRTRASEGEEDEVVEPPDSEGGSDIYDSERGSSFYDDEYSDEWDEDDEDYLELHDTYHPEEQK